MTYVVFPTDCGPKIAMWPGSSVIADSGRWLWQRGHRWRSVGRLQFGQSSVAGRIIQSKNRRHPRRSSVQGSVHHGLRSAEPPIIPRRPLSARERMGSSIILAKSVLQ
ncbi:hypothetical protein ACYOEI_07870 [Singulisphaera rosea]